VTGSSETDRRSCRCGVPAADGDASGRGGDRRWSAAVGTVAGGPRWGPSLVGRGEDRRWWATVGTVAGGPR